jgi:hypothetical protein
MEEDSGGTEDLLLPSLKSVCNPDFPYCSNVIPVVVKVRGLFYSSVRISLYFWLSSFFLSAASMLLQHGDKALMAIQAEHHHYSQRVLLALAFQQCLGYFRAKCKDCILLLLLLLLLFFVFFFFSPILISIYG